MSALALGTAQFGQPYGVANVSGEVAGTIAVDIVATAWDGGAREFDTASGYGESEAVLGEALRTLGLADSATVITKIAHLTAEELSDPVAARARLRASVEGSRQRLGLDSLPLALFHRDTDAVHISLLLELVERGWIDKIGVFCGHDPKSASARAGTAGIAAIQLPANLMDRRHLDGGAFDAAQRAAMPVYVRSIYLQGLLLMEPASVPAYLGAAHAALEAVEAIAADSGLSRTELALRAALSLPGDVRLLVGAETPAQVEQNCRLHVWVPCRRRSARGLCPRYRLWARRSSLHRCGRRSEASFRLPKEEDAKLCEIL